MESKMADTLIRDNKNYGSVAEFLRDVIKKDSELSIVSAYFTIFLKNQLSEPTKSKFHTPTKRPSRRSIRNSKNT